jgi:hypothetical protein
MSNVIHVEFPGRRADIIRTAEEFAIRESMQTDVNHAATRIVMELQMGDRFGVNVATLKMLDLVEELFYEAGKGLKHDDGGSAA